MEAIQSLYASTIEPVDSLTSPERLTQRSSSGSTTTSSESSQQDMIEVAKDFESILLTQCLNEMKNTIGQWGSEKDGAGEQIDGIFWSHLGQEMGSQGGIGLWKQLAQDFEMTTSPSTESEELKQTL